WASLMLEGAQPGGRSMWVMPYERVLSDRPASVERISATMGVNRLLRGEFQPFSDRIRLTLTIEDARTQRQLRSAVVDLAPKFEGLPAQLDTAMSRLLGVDVSPGPAPMEDEDTPAFPLFLEGLGYLDYYKHADNNEQALDRLRSAVEIAPGFATARMALSMAYVRGNARDGGESWLEMARAEMPVAFAIDSVGAWPRTVRAEVLRALNRDRDAELQARGAIHDQPDAIRGHEMLMDVLIASRRYAEAIEVGKKLADQFPDYYRAHWRLGWLYRRINDPESSVREHLLANRLAPGNDGVLGSLGVHYYQAGDYPRAREFFERSYLVKPTYASSSNVGALMYLEGRFEDSARYYQYALELGDSSSYINWGNWASSLYWVDGNREQAIPLFQRAVDLALDNLDKNPDDATVIARLADYYAMMGKVDDARGMIARAARYDDAEVDFRIACAYEKLGDREKSLEYLNRAIQAEYPMQDIEREPLFRDLRRDARFQMLGAPIEK
ncbi:MAG: tetratricopeptide repeat protein, partial [Candidatus Krumholzibacteria bacterium]|nr:tetratricopeptide repeat protein [Candidatus Krumholzibacteria bacterium]